MNNGGNGYDIGDVANLTLLVKDGDYALTDATTISCTIQRFVGGVATGAAVVYNVVGSDDDEVIRLSVGSYAVRYPITADSFYRYRWVTTGTGAGASEGSFYVRTTTFET
jgi:hypothetical protein